MFQIDDLTKVEEVVKVIEKEVLNVFPTTLSQPAFSHYGHPGPSLAAEHAFALREGTFRQRVRPSIHGFRSKLPTAVFLLVYWKAFDE